MELTETQKEKLLTIGKEWKTEDKYRIYFNDLYRFADLEIERYGTGSIKTAYLKGEKLSNSKAYKMVINLESERLFFDMVVKQFVFTGDDGLKATLVSNILKQI